MLEKTVPVMLDAAPVAPDIMIYPPTAAAQVGSPLLWNSKRLYLGRFEKNIVLVKSHLKAALELKPNLSL